MTLPPTRERAPSREARRAPSWRGLAAPGAATGKRRPESRVGAPRSPAHRRARAPVPICRRGRGGRKRQASTATARPASRASQDSANPQASPRAPDGPRPVLASAADGGHHPVYRFLLPLWGFCHALGQARAWARHAGGPGTRVGRSRVGCSFVAHRNPVAQAAHPGYGGALGGAPRCGAKKDVGSNAQIASAANTVLCSRRLYIVQSGQRRKTGHVKGGND
jgi:hypothetical protein